MTVGSLFAGIGGFDLGFERAGYEIKWQVEINPFCRAVLRKHWPAVRKYADVRRVGAHNLEPVDVLCGGFPCQDISLAGAGAGLDGARSGLWTEYRRIIRELRPRYVVVENVAALLGRGLGRVLGDLAASGYDAEWDCIPASAVGAPHRRDRVWLVAYTDWPRLEGRDCGDVREGAAQCTARPRRPSKAQSLAHADERQQALGRQHGGMGQVLGPRLSRTDCWEIEPTVGRVAHGVSAELDGDDDGNQEHGAQIGSASREGAYGVSAVRGNGKPNAASPGLFQAEGSRGALSDVPHQGGSTGRNQTNETAEAVFGMRSAVSAEALEEALHMRPRVFSGGWPPECLEALARHWSIGEPDDTPRVAIGVDKRMDRLKGLGNAIVPQIAEWIAHRIQEAEGLSRVKP